MELIRADIVARFKITQGYEVFLNTGTDEHGQKIFQTATERGMTPQEHVDAYSQEFKKLLTELNISPAHFIRTTDAKHVAAAQEFWKRCTEAGYIYKKKYAGLYCMGCEMFITEKGLIDGECPHHPGKKLEHIEEENYFFKLSEFTKPLLAHFNANPDFVIPATRHGEMVSMLEGGLEDFSISRLSQKLPWGVPVPNDSEQTMYVWFDALVSYIATLDWPKGEGEDEKSTSADMQTNSQFTKFWKEGNPIQYCGKDNTQHQSIRWQAMLMSVGLPLSKNIIVNGFISSEGKKMSKSIGNVISPFDLIEKYGADALRYFLVREVHPFEDTDVTLEKINESYTAHLVNGIGNVTSRILQMAQSYCDEKIDVQEVELDADFVKEIKSFNLQKAADIIWKKIGDIDEYIAQTKPFQLAKTDRGAAAQIVAKLVQDLAWVATHVEIFMPETAARIHEAIEKQEKPEQPLFARIEL
jgi:methionyl-tRNA synthetase